MTENPLPTFESWQQAARGSPEETVDRFLARIERYPPEEKRSMIAVHPERDQLVEALKNALEWNLPLAGVPYALQDLFDIAGLPTRCGAPFQAPFEAPAEDSCLLARTLETAGTTLFLKSMPAEFGVAPLGTNATAGTVTHAGDSSLVPGGGSGASARLVADGVVPIAFGLDSWGGVRIPAAFNGLFCFRLPPDAHAREGVFPLFPSLESVGWVTGNLSDLRTSLSAFYENPAPANHPSMRGFLLQDPSVRMNSAVKAGLFEITRFLDMGDDVALNNSLGRAFQNCGSSFRILAERELYSIHKYWIEEYGDSYDPYLLQRIERGMDCSVAAVDEAVGAQENIREAVTEFFQEYDFLILPASPEATPREKEWTPSLEKAVLALIAPASLAYLPVVSVPFDCGNHRYGAAQILLNPRKIKLLPALLEKLAGFYASRTTFPRRTDSE